MKILLWLNLSVCIYMKLFLKYLNNNPCPPHSTSTYTYKVTIVSIVRGGGNDLK